MTSAQPAAAPSIHRYPKDGLTGLPNRRALEDIARLLVGRASLERGFITAVALDLDKFRGINACFGHATGDQLLVLVSDKLRDAVAQGGCVGRFSGDEFLFLLPYVTADAAHGFAEEILAGLWEPLTVSGYDFRLAGSIGIASYPDPAGSANELLVQAGVAMHQAKREGGLLIRHYNPALAKQERLKNRLRLDLRSAVGTPQLCFYYQPFYSASTRRLAGAEALLRWRNQNLGLLAPGDFLSLIDEPALRHSLNEWSVRTLTEQIAAWSRDKCTVPISLNLSPRQLCDERLPQLFSRALAASGVSGTAIIVEVTEDAIMADADAAAAVISELSLLGISIAIDDFGTGYSTFGRLKTLPIDCVKIDKDFIQSSSSDPKSLLTTEAIISLAKALDMKVVAEGIESADSLEFACGIGCDYVQGHWLGTPMPVADFSALLPDRAA